MKGIHFVTDENNKKVAVQISYEIYGDTLDNLIDGLVAEERKNDEMISLDQFAKELKDEGLLK